MECIPLDSIVLVHISLLQDYKKISSQTGADRYRLLLSDGIFSHSCKRTHNSLFSFRSIPLDISAAAMLATQLNEKVTNGELEPFSVIKLDKYLCNTINGNRLDCQKLIITTCTVCVLFCLQTRDDSVGDDNRCKGISGLG